MTKGSRDGSGGGPGGGSGGGDPRAERERRLAEALRANLRRRKAQMKSRRAGDADDRAGVPAAMSGSAGNPPESER